MKRFPIYFTQAILCSALLSAITVSAQTVTIPQPDPPKNWHVLDLKTEGFYGISLHKAYAALKGKRSKPVVVATIDSGIDTLQKDLRSILWINTKEIPGNGKDDDGNGYIDDIHGWNFLGGPGGKCDFTETTEEVREYNRLRTQYAPLTEATATDKKAFAYWQQVKMTYDSTIAKSARELKDYSEFLNALVASSAYLKRALNLQPNDSFTLASVSKLQSTDESVQKARDFWKLVMQEESATTTSAQIIKELTEYLAKLNNDINPDLEARQRIVGDDPNVWESTTHGSNLLKFEDASHGTGVAGLIGALHGNKYGIDGVADNVRIMAIKAVPNGDEYDEDIARAIRYAVDNGAKVINMSFGKKLSPHKAWVDEAFKYAAAHDVLLVQAAGNDNQDVDTKPQFPNDTFEDGSATDADNVICVGASGSRADETLAGSFSNYGKRNVDVFAPGVKVTSVDKDAEFNTADGTSFASPITAGVAALLLEYYPNLSARQLKQIILQSAKPINKQVLLPGSKTDKVDFTTLSKSGGIVNAYDAVLIAGKVKGERKN
ncbi:S8 family serine peptidase [Mucilaginibacter lacusdianchii]|uniref:S8 family serine peptidase n=1 Tax=Mucilaginibacter lacusdianchii TaxID=2684211 RepID=UPI00131A8F69|nr:S8 family serine peptidase [Mucilaginibacter sp. JXJ CY 39]